MAETTKHPPFPYATADHEEIPCNLCGSREQEVFCKTDRNRLPVRSVICKRCGLMYVSPRMTTKWYSHYYDVEYRRQMSAYKKARPMEKGEKLERMFQSQLRRGAWLADYLKKHAKSPPRSVLDVGSSTGGLLSAMQREFGARVLGIEPSPEETAFAVAHGVPTRQGLFEDFRPEEGDKFDLVICTQSYNHLLDPKRVTEQIRACLNPGGMFFLECLDFFKVCEYREYVADAVQIDHVYMFVTDTMKAMLETSGFSVMEESVISDRLQSSEELLAQKRTGMPTHHTRMLAIPGEPAKSLSCSYAKIRAELGRMPNSILRIRLKEGLKQLADFSKRLRGSAKGSAGKSKTIKQRKAG